jgi:retinol dehydrogenase 12
MERPVCLITGATDGLGKFTALELAQRGFTVVFAARDQAKAEPIKSTMVATDVCPEQGKLPLA